MCTISHQKCVCFVFLVVLAVLSCSGFRMDNLAMTDVSKRNSGALELFAGGAHRLRHRRQMPATGARRRLQCPEVDASWKAYKAGAVAVATVESQTYNCKNNCTLQFRIHEWLKNPDAYKDKLIRLNFRKTRRGVRCENENPAIINPYFLVKNNNNKTKHKFKTKIKHESRAKHEPKTYILFLRADGPHNYKAVYTPEVNETRTYKPVMKVSQPDFRPKPIRVDKILERFRNRTSLKLRCKVVGFPIPVITWKVNNTTIRTNNHRWITQKKKRSTLTIHAVTPADWGQYECVAKSVDGNISNAVYTLTGQRERPGTNSTVSDSDDRKPCDKRFKTDYCLNGGSCYYMEVFAEYWCECADGYTGTKCEIKTFPEVRRYPQPSISTCSVGLYTKYNKC